MGELRCLVVGDKAKRQSFTAPRYAKRFPLHDNTYNFSESTPNFSDNRRNFSANRPWLSDKSLNSQNTRMFEL